MAKKVLIAYYSQSGQLAAILRNFSVPLVEAGALVEFMEIRPKFDFSFPWSSKRFFDVFPESVLGVPVNIEPLTAAEPSYDLVVFGYQPWYLSPSIPATSALKNEQFKKLLAGRPVVTVIGARNMWVSAQERVKKMLTEAGAKLVGNIVFTDRNTNLISAVTIVHWMMGGKKDKYLGIFPKPGVSDSDIANAGQPGNIVTRHLLNGNWESLQGELRATKAVEVKPNLVFIEERGSRIFSIWAGVIIKKKNRTPWLTFFKYYLAGALFLLSPVLITIYSLFFKPFLTRKIAAQKEYYSGVN